MADAFTRPQHMRCEAVASCPSSMHVCMHACTHRCGVAAGGCVALEAGKVGARRNAPKHVRPAAGSQVGVGAAASEDVDCRIASGQVGARARCAKAGTCEKAVAPGRDDVNSSAQHKCFCVAHRMHDCRQHLIACPGAHNEVRQWRRSQCAAPGRTWSPGRWPPLRHTSLPARCCRPRRPRGLWEWTRPGPPAQTALEAQAMEACGYHSSTLRGWWCSADGCAWRRPCNGPAACKAWTRAEERLRPNSVRSRLQCRALIRRCTIKTGAAHPAAASAHHHPPLRIQHAMPPAMPRHGDPVKLASWMRTH